MAHKDSLKLSKSDTRELSSLNQSNTMRALIVIGIAMACYLQIDWDQSMSEQSPQAVGLLIAVCSYLGSSLSEQKEDE